MAETLFILVKIVVIVLPLMLAVAYLTFAERKIIGYIQVRLGPNRVGFRGLLQPIADTVKLLLKEIIVAGWASNSRYAFFGAMRSAAQMVSYEIAMGFALVGVLTAAGSLNLREIVLAQEGSLFHWFWLPLFPLFLVYFISGVAETNRAPFDVAEGESEIVAGFHIEYSVMAFGAFFLAEYANMILIAALASVFFLGGWLSPFDGYPVVGDTILAAPSFFWFGLKIFA